MHPILPDFYGLQGFCSKTSDAAEHHDPKEHEGAVVVLKLEWAGLAVVRNDQGAVPQDPHLPPGLLLPVRDESGVGDSGDVL